MWEEISRVELAVGLVRHQHGVAEEVSGGLGLLGERHHVGRRRQVPVLMAPELASSSEACSTH